MNNNRIIQFDYIRSLSIILVIFIHSMAWINEVTVINSTYIVRVMIDSVIYTGVPLFVMLSGALLLGKEEPISLFFKKRFKRLIIPFIIWSIFIYAILYIQDGGRSIIGYATSYITKTLTSGVYGIYWYMYLIIGLYLITPILRKVCATKDTCIYTSLFYFVFFIIYSIFPSIKICNRFVSENFLYVGYFVTGYAIYQYLQHKKNFCKISLILLIIFVALKILSNIVLHAASLDEYAVTINKILTALISISLFSTLVKLPIKTECKRNKYVSFLSETSYAIYLTHFVFISIFTKLSVIKSIPLAMEPFVMVILVVICESLLMYFIKKTRLKKVLL